MSKAPPLAVVKVGGDILLDPAQLNGLASNILALTQQGWRVVLLHGGGPQVSSLQKKLGLPVNKIDGRRITSIEDLQVIKQAIAGEANVNLVSTLIKFDIPAVGLHGASAKIIEARKRRMMQLPSSPKPVDLGEVGDVIGINKQLLEGLMNQDLVPVIATLGIDSNGKIYNINADTTAIKIAEKLKADMLLLITAVGAVYEDLNDNASRIKVINQKSAEQLIKNKIIRDGMIPKVQEALQLISLGVNKVVILSAREPNTFTSVANGNNDFGTTIH